MIRNALEHNDSDKEEHLLVLESLSKIKEKPKESGDQGENKDHRESEMVPLHE